MKYLSLAAGIWCLFYAWRGINPEGMSKRDAGKRMRLSTRLIFLIGGTLITAVGIFLWVW